MSIDSTPTADSGDSSSSEETSHIDKSQIKKQEKSYDEEVYAFQAARASKDRPKCRVQTKKYEICSQDYCRKPTCKRDYRSEKDCAIITKNFEVLPLWLRAKVDAGPYYHAKGLIMDDTYNKVGPLDALRDPSQPKDFLNRNDNPKHLKWRRRTLRLLKPPNQGETPFHMNCSSTTFTTNILYHFVKFVGTIRKCQGKNQRTGSVQAQRRSNNTIKIRLGLSGRAST